MNGRPDLSLLGLGVDDDVQPADRYPDLRPGNHLRWAFAQHRGFPQNGYYLFRREHTGPRADPILLTDAIPSKVIRRGVETSFSTPDGDTFEFSDASTYQFVDEYDLAPDRRFTGGGDGDWEFRFEAHTTQTITLPETAHRVEVSLAVEGAGTATVSGLADDRVVATETVSTSGVVTLEADHVEAVRIEGTATTLVELACFSLAAEATVGWSLLPEAPAPVTLPFSHPDYLADTGPEDLPAARQTAGDRVEYGDADRFAPDPVAVASDGTVSVTADSAIVDGQGTDWDADLGGSVLHVAGDDTGYVVAEVLAPDRLALGRAYRGNSASNAGYELRRDPFGQLHDSLTHLVDDGLSAGGMASRVTPEPVHAQGTLERREFERTVDGFGTGWTDELEGLTLRVARDLGGTATVMHGLPMAISQSADWDEELVGDWFQLDGERERYTVTDVQSFSYQGTSIAVLSLDRPVSGLHYPSQGLDYHVFESEGVEVDAVTDATTLELADPHPGSDDNADRNYLIAPSFAAGGAGTDAPSTPFQYPIDLALMASLDPAAAQLLGLYWIDETAAPDTAYDYLVVADHGVQAAGEPVLTRAPRAVQPADLLSATDHPLVDWAVTFDVQPGDAGVRSEPTGTEATPLPPMAGRSDVGLRWDQTADPTTPDSVGTYYLWRRDCGDEPPPATPEPGDYEVLERDDAAADDSFMAAAEPVPRTGEQAPLEDPLPGWPSEPMDGVDTAVTDGWYSYRVSSMDLFGRHSPLSDPATWTDDGATHPHPAADRAVEVAADLPPPPPTGVEGSALDPDDPHVRADSDYESWRADNPGEVGLRVRWLWTSERAASAPDVDAFRIQFEPGRLNARVGTVDGVSSAGGTVRVETDIASSAGPDQFAGATLQVGARGFPVVASGGDPLWVEVEPADPTAPTAAPDGGFGDDGAVEFPSDPLDGGTVDVDGTTITLAPVSAGDDCTLSIPAAYDRGTVTIDGETVTADGAPRAVVRGTDTGWAAALAGQEFRTVDDVEAYEVYRVDSATRLLLDRPYEPSTELPARNRAYAIAHPAGTDYTDVAEWSRQLDTVPYDEVAEIEDGTRVYETFVTLDDTSGFEPTVTDPKAFAHVSVNAVDAAGQDGPVGAPAKVARVYREPPAPPSIPVIDADFEWATEADYHGTSRYTVRWEPPGDGLETHVFRALDESLFATDWERRQAAIDDGRGDELTLSAEDHARFPPPLRPEPGDDESTRQSKRQSRETIAAELNRLNDPSDIGSEDEAMAFYRGLREPANDTDAVEQVKPAMLQVLAALPGNESAFTQVTVESLAAADHPNKPGPDTGPEESYPQGDLAAYVDEFDGRSNNTYLYRTGTVDPAGNRSDQRDPGDGEPMSYPTPAVKTPDVVAPKRPVVTKTLAGHPDESESGDRMITAWLAPTTETGLAGYDVYRTDDADATRDSRLMEQVAAGVPPAESGETVWTDANVEPFTAQYYRFVAVDEAGNRSEPSAVVSARAFDDSRPDPPTWDEAITDDDGTATLSWTLAAPDHRPLLQRRPPDGGSWTNVTGWLAPGTEETVDAARDPGETFDYQLLVVSSDGRGNDEYNRRSV